MVTTAKTAVQRLKQSAYRLNSDGLRLVVIKSGAVTEVHLIVTPLKNETVRAMVTRLAKAFAPWNATAVRLIIFGSAKAHAETLELLRQALNDEELQATGVEGADCFGNNFAGIQIHAIAGVQVLTLRSNDNPQARIWNDANAVHCVLNAVFPSGIRATRQEQAHEVFEKLRNGLAQADMTMKDAVRTWFYLDDILSWYVDYNRVRNSVFERDQLQPAHFPASTGVGGRNSMSAALVAAAWAVRPHDKTAKTVRFISSPEQGPASSYGSAFSRAVEINSGCRRLLVSGTASIARNGRTEHVGDAQAQIERTMQIVEAILKSRRMSFENTVFATAFFKLPSGAHFFADWLARHNWQSMPLICAQCDICRDDLLFEVELEAVAAG